MEHSTNNDMAPLPAPVSASYRDVLVAICACLGPFSAGLTLGYSSPAIPPLQEEQILTTDQTTWFASLVTIGGLIGGPIAGVLGERFGRKTGVLCSSLPYALGWLCIYATDSYVFLYIGRILTGLASSLIFTCVPLYVAEVSCKDRRGRLVASFQIGTTSGILAVNSIGLRIGWRWTTVICSVFPVIMTLSLLPMPETPRWLLSKDRKEEALTSLRWLRGDSCEREIEKEMCEIEQALLEHKDQATWKDFTQKYLYKPLIISVALMIFQQFCGINAVILYEQSIFQDSGWSGDPGVPAIIVSAVKVTATAFSVSLTDRAGRRLLFISGGILLTLSCASFGTFLYLTTVKHVEKSSLDWLSLGSLIVYVIAFSLGWGSIPVVIMSEIFPLKARGKASSITIFVNWLCAFIVTKEFLALQDVLTNYGTFWMFGTICLLGTLFVFVFLPETKGRTLEEIETFFNE